MDSGYWEQNTYKKLLKDNNLPDVDFHSLRRFYITYALSLGIPVGDVSDLVGHSSSKMTLDTYRQHIPDNLDKRVNDLDEWFNSIRLRNRLKKENRNA